MVKMAHSRKNQYGTTPVKKNFLIRKGENSLNIYIKVGEDQLGFAPWGEYSIVPEMGNYYIMCVCVYIYIYIYIYASDLQGNM